MKKQISDYKYDFDPIERKFYKNVDIEFPSFSIQSNVFFLENFKDRPDVYSKAEERLVEEVLFKTLCVSFERMGASPENSPKFAKESMLCMYAIKDGYDLLKNK